MKATVDRNKCIGCGRCVEFCIDVFEMGDDNIAVVTVDVVPSDAKDSCKKAAEGCPIGAIEIQE